jgi:hypothetical protein
MGQRQFEYLILLFVLDFVVCNPQLSGRPFSMEAVKTRDGAESQLNTL